jgi:hypothetical protein
MYDNVDRDRGEEIFYSAADANTTINEMADKNNSSTQSLIRSVTTKKPVRVLRTAQGKWEGAPKRGIRYDGLYEVTEWHEKRNKMGGTYILFHLIRRNDQAPIDRARPSQEEIKAFEMVKDGY